MLKFILPLVLPLSLFAAPSDLRMISVGDYGGIRLKAPCAFGANEFLCSVDTMGSVSVVPQSAAFAGYRVVREENITGIGISLRCEVLAVGDFSMLGNSAATFAPLRCPFEHSVLPLIGLPFFEGKRFHFNFGEGKFDWTLAGGSRASVRRIGETKGWLGLDAVISGNKVLASFDTGNPVTMVMQSFVRRNPALFRASDLPIDLSLRQKGMSLFEILAPIEVNGVKLEAEYVYAIESLPFPDAKDLDFVLGMNHMRRADWSFDLGSDEFFIQP